MPDFPKTLPFVTGRKQRRYLRDGPSITEIMVLDDNGEQRNQYGPGGHFGVYFWNGKVWELAGTYGSRVAARRAAANIRQTLKDGGMNAVG